MKMDINTYNCNDFAMELFLDDSISTMNKLVVAVANVVSENSRNIGMVNNILIKGYNETAYQYLTNKIAPSMSQKTTGFYEDIVQHLSEEAYIGKFHMKRCTVQKLIDFLAESVPPSSSIVPLDKKVHVFLLVMTSHLSYNQIGKLFSLNKSSVCYIFHEIATLIAEQRYHFITWPSIEEQHITRIKVNSYFKFPNCVGFIDACRFKIHSKNKKRYRSDIVLLQAVCDESLMFIDIHIGEIGNLRKGKLFKDSSLAHELKNFVDFENHILGDSNYKLRKNLITPFTSEELLTSEEMKFNEVHSKTHSYILRAFERLKDQFHRLYYIDVTKQEYVISLICAACVLYNFVLLHEGNSQLKEEPVTCEDGVNIDPTIVKTATEKRQFLCNYINFIDNAKIDSN